MLDLTCLNEQKMSCIHLKTDRLFNIYTLRSFAKFIIINFEKFIIYCLKRKNFFSSLEIEIGSNNSFKKSCGIISK